MDKLSELIQEIEKTENEDFSVITYKDLLAAINELPEPFGTIPIIEYEPRKEMDVGFFYCPYIPIMRNPGMGVVAMMTGA